MKQRIKELFASLSKGEQIELLKELSSTTQTSMSIAEFSVLHQKRYGRNVEFTVKQEGLDHAPMITAICHTAFGNFEGKGSNQKIAKANAIENASKNM